MKKIIFFIFDFFLPLIRMYGFLIAFPDDNKNIDLNYFFSIRQNLFI